MMTNSAVATTNAEGAEGIETSDRRRFLARLSAVGAGVVGGIAVTFADIPTAAAINVVACCYLATNTPCGGHWNNDGHFTCPSGTSRHYWACCCGSTIYHCWECDNGSSCDNGTVYRCSNWARFPLPSCCNSNCSCPVT
jgi:hypothetical protein